MNAIYVVGGLTEETVGALTEEFLELDGVEEVAADLATGRVTVTIVWPLTDEDVRAVVEGAGLELINPA